MEQPDWLVSLVDATTDGLWVLDRRGTTVWANRAMAHLLRRDLGEMAGLPAHEVFPAGQRTRIEMHLSMLARGTRGRDNLPVTLQRADGTLVGGLMSYSPVREDGRTLGWLHRFTAYDAAHSPAARPERPAGQPSGVAPADGRQVAGPGPDAHDEVLSRQLVEAQEIAGIGSFSWDLETGEVVWSDQLHRLYGVPREEFDGTVAAFEACLHPDDRAHVQAATEEALRDRVAYEFDARVLRPDGEQRWIHGRCRIIRDPATGRPVRIGGTNQDVTEVRRAEVAATAATARLRLLQQMAMASNRARTLEEAIEVAALRLPEHTGWEPVAAWTSERPGLLTQVWPAHDPGLGQRRIDQDGAGRPPSPTDLAERVLVSGEVAVQPLHDRGRAVSRVTMPVVVTGEVLAVLEVLADEDPLSEASHELVEQVAAQLGVVAERERAAAALADARDRAMEASRMKSEFLATMSHEIRTPMNGVIGLNELLLRTELDDHQRRLADGVHQSGLSLLAIINDILDLSKIEAGKLELEDVDFEVRSVFEQTASVLSSRAHEKGVELVVACHPDVPEYLRGDPTRLGQVLTNLGSNALKFTEDGEVSIQARVEHQDRDGVVLRVDVSDTGIGIPASAQAHLFDAFTQADLATTRRHGGTGLGLAICQQLVEAMDGQIQVDSAVGEGSTFSFTARLAHTPSAPRRSTAAPESLRGRRVLVVDDNETNRFILTEQLRAWQLEPVAVATPAECLATLREAQRAQKPFTLALLDLVLPRIDGLELARIIKADPALADLALVLLTSDQGVGARTAREAGISTTLSKPVRHSELYDAVLRTLGEPQEPTPRAPRRLVVPSLDLRVLVVEDNPVNQLVATGLLEALGVEVDVADDGEAAIAALAGPDHGYALVLMDCRMPGIDGIDATRAIRGGEPRGTRVPIIAMTASALEGERERCLAAGMDDFLTKPVDPTQLEEVVQRWTRRTGAVPAPRPGSTHPAAPGPRHTAEAGGRSATGGGTTTALADPARQPSPPELSEPPSELPPGEAPVVDEERRKVLAELVKDGESFFDRTARSFVGRIDGQVADIRTALEARDAYATFTNAHLVKGSALNLGLPRVSAASAAVEAHAHAGDLSGIEPKLELLEREVAVAVAELRRRLG
ncbi:response regulator [Nocardioides sp.]|uniref:response regulator n=1 Tax=Nocardioides sp. TaxID=35761 RepID=UPI00262E9DCD|nr:response regulator [Nocardioides sp.]